MLKEFTMNTRYKITRLNEQEEPILTLEDFQQFFSTQSDFTYEDAFVSRNQEGVEMRVKGDFFMWRVDQVKVPFRFFDGELYVAISHPVIEEKMKEIAAALDAVYVEG